MKNTKNKTSMKIGPIAAAILITAVTLAPGASAASALLVGTSPAPPLESGPGTNGGAFCPVHTSIGSVGTALCIWSEPGKGACVAFDLRHGSWYIVSLRNC